jgi:DEAD/DEAH box helicase domain-containing protein
VAWARNADDARLPLVTLRLQVWIRELRRMIAKLAVAPENVQLRAGADLKANRDGLYLPLIQCAECLTTGWLGRLPAASTRLRDDLDEIYNTWFRGQLEIARFYPRRFDQPQVEGITAYVCPTCGGVQYAPGECASCGAAELLEGFFVTGQYATHPGGQNIMWHDKTCPACGAEDALLLLGSRSTTLGAQIIDQTWGTRFNDDKKLIAFSDSVQDAAHRAGFFGARTYLNNVRTAMTKAIKHFATPSVPWNDFVTQLPELFRDPASPLRMADEEFVVQFLGPNMGWQRDWAEELIEHGALPKGVSSRAAWKSG